MVRRAEAALDRIDPRALLAVAVAASGILLLVLLSHLTFFGDDWDPLLFRRGFNLDVLLRPHAEHILLAPTLIYKGIQATIGMESLVPYAVVTTGSFLASAVLLFLYLRARVGDWLALAGVLPVLFMGTAWEVLLLPASINFTGSMAAGIGALLALERRDGRRDALVCALLVVSLAFSELALCFALGVAVWMIVARRPWSRAYVIAVPLLLYAGWYAGWGHTAQSHVSVHNLVHSPKYILDALASSAGSLLGTPNIASIWVGRPLLVLLVVAVVLRVRSPKPLPRSLWSALAVLLSFWFLAALGTMPGREPNASRYQYVGGVLLLMVLGRPGQRDQAAAAGRARGPRDRLPGGDHEPGGPPPLLREDVRLDHAGSRRAGGVRGRRRQCRSRLHPRPGQHRHRLLNSLEVGPYLSAVDAFGSPTYGAVGLAGASEEARVAADQLLADAEELRPVAVNRPPAPAGPPPRFVGGAGGLAAPQGSCLTVPGGAASPRSTCLAPG